MVLLSNGLNRELVLLSSGLNSGLVLLSSGLNSGSTNITKFFLQVMCELKIAQLKRATPYLRILALAERAEFVRLPNDEISHEIPRFARVQSNPIA